MKFTDCIAVLVFLLLAALVFFFPWSVNVLTGAVEWSGLDFSGSFRELTGLKNFGGTVGAWPYISGFLKVGVLATFGEMIKTRGRTGSYRTPQLLPKFLVWGLYGMIFTLTFALFAKGVAGISGTPVWPFRGEGRFWETLVFAFSTSLWLNLIFCYPMMLSHEWCNFCIREKRLTGGSAFLHQLDPHTWGSYLPKTILFFWVPAHTLTFCLPPSYRILMSAFLSLALGFILTLSSKK